jgi:hypothetical protein
MATYNLVQVVYDRSGLSANEDVAVNVLHIRQVVQASPDILPVTDQGRQNFVQDFKDYWVQVRPLVTSKVKVRELRFYDVPSTPGTDMGDPVLVEPIDLAGTGTGLPLPPQCAISVTLKTAVRKRWGRFYLPGPTTAYVDANGRFDNSGATILANAVHDLTDRSGTGACLVVFSRVHWNHADPTEIQVDDIYDVVRRRRFSEPHNRTIVSAG